ncbi:MAG: hypothetical protein ACRCVT_07350 [Leadbetterella sp.]
MKITIISIISSLLLIISCGNVSNSYEGDEKFYFTITIDGKEEVNFPPNEVTTSYTIINKPVFKVFAGEYSKINLMLTTAQDVSKACSTPSGSTNLDDEITQGSVSLQNYPEKGYTSNSFAVNFPEASTPIPNAIVITESKRFGDSHRIITGTINVKVFGGDDRNDPKVKDHTIAGKFRIKHEFKGVVF